MKVAVLIRGLEEAGDGGSNTFEQNVYNALLRQAGSTSHKFVLFGSAKQLPENGRDRFEYCSFAQFQDLPYDDTTLFRHIRSAVHLRALKIADFFSRKKTLKKYVQEQVEKFGVEVFWCVSPVAMTGVVRELQHIGVPYVITLWDLAHRVHPEFPEVCAKGEWERRETFYSNALPRAAAIITGTEAGKQEILRYYAVNPGHIHIAPFPTPDFVFRSNPARDVREMAQRYSLPPDYLFYPAQFWAHKNHITILKALTSLRQRGIEQPAVFVGSEKGNRAYIEQCAREMGLLDQVHFLGVVPQADLINLYRNALALVFPTLFGPDNIPPLEAFALGCPVLASRVSGAAEQLGDAALLFDPLNPKELAELIASIRENPSIREALVKSGQSRALRSSSADYLSRVFAVFDQFSAKRSCWGTEHEKI